MSTYEVLLHPNKEKSTSEPILDKILTARFPLTNLGIDVLANGRKR